MPMLPNAASGIQVLGPEAGSTPVAKERHQGEDKHLYNKVIVAMVARIIGNLGV